MCHTELDRLAAQLGALLLPALHRRDPREDRVEVGGEVLLTGLPRQGAPLGREAPTL